MKKNNYTFLITGALIGVCLTVNLLNLISIMKDAIDSKDHMFQLGDLLVGKKEDQLAMELTMGKASVWKTINTIIFSQWISLSSVIIYWVAFLVMVFKGTELKGMMARK